MRGLLVLPSPVARSAGAVIDAAETKIVDLPRRRMQLVLDQPSRNCLEYVADDADDADDAVNAADAVDAVGGAAVAVAKNTVLQSNAGCWERQTDLVMSGGKNYSH